MANDQMNFRGYFSLLVPIYNEEKILEKNAKKILLYLKKNSFHHFDILICDNGSTDDSADIAKKLSKSNPAIKHIHTNKKGLGVGLKEGLKYSKYNNLIYYSIDLSFNLSFINDSLKILENNAADIIIGSKGHKNSKVNRPLIRRVLSYIHNLIFNVLFGMNIKDPHGAFAFRKSDVIKFIYRLTSNDAFFQTQLLIWANEYNKRIKEVPVIASDFRSSTHNIKIEMFSILTQLFKEYFILLKSKYNGKKE